VIQVLQHKTNPSQFFVYNRWGRVGVKGQDKFMGPMGEEKALKEYNTKLHEKSVKGDYRVLELDYTKEGNKSFKDIIPLIIPLSSS